MPKIKELLSLRRFELNEKLGGRFYGEAYGDTQPFSTEEEHKEMLEELDFLASYTSWSKLLDEAGIK